jgi:hypothetical protein
MHDLGWLSGQTVCNLHVANAHTFSVGTDGVIAHNSSCSSARVSAKAWQHIYERHVSSRRNLGTSKFTTKSPRKIRP